MYKKQKDVKIEAENKPFDINDYKDQVKLLDNFFKASKIYGTYIITEIDKFGTPRHELVQIEKLITSYHLEPLLKLLKEKQP
jgi:hypothetical protein